MGSFATALAASGYEVTGSDGKLYEPMKSVLANAKIQLLEGFLAENTSKVSPDLVVIGNVVRKDNPEARAWLEKGVTFQSFPEAVRTFLIQDKISVVCSGTHGKTTTTSWIAFLLDQLGMNPSYLVGGVPIDLPAGCRLTDGNLFVGEGDEYDSAFFDKGPKFLHYAPHFAILANIEFDHADIYKDLEHVKASFEKLVSILPGDGLCIARYDDPVVMEVAPLSLCPVQTFGTGAGAMWKLGAVKETKEGFEFEVIYKGRSVGTFKSPMFGEHNLLNIVSGIIVAVNLGVPMEKIRPIVEKFHGAKRRQEVLLRTPITLVDDFAHHPTEVAATIKAVKRRYSEGKLWALFEPRSATARRNVHQGDYAKAFHDADRVLISSPFKSQDLKEGERLSSDTLVQELVGQGKNATATGSSDEIVKIVKAEIQPGDTILVMSNGEFDKIQEKLKAALL
jgi:UDP-N-acetylmuramate: L-alanyl-gamma-D-glutamyl-meso-diaminopimelate ligase